MKRLLFAILLSVCLVLPGLLTACTPKTRYVTIIQTTTLTNSTISVLTQPVTETITVTSMITPTTVTSTVGGGATVTQTITQTKTVTSTTTAPSTTTTTASTTTSGDLRQITLEIYNAFRENEAAATLKYKNQLIRLEGKVSYIGSYWSGWNVTLYEPFTYDIECYFNADHVNEVAALVKGQTVQVEGTCDGASAFGDPELINCRILP